MAILVQKWQDENRLTLLLSTYFGLPCYIILQKSLEQIRSFQRFGATGVPYCVFVRKDDIFSKFECYFYLSIVPCHAVIFQKNH